ncbi:MAG: TIGR00282 family metallophosphoesterase [Clostridia bacterium]|nr:TIGR00282 family metallophosphoesterase [Clostridia bacterium]
MNILVLGDVVGEIGCQFLRKKLPAFKKHKAIDFTVANGENSGTGNGITPFSAEYLFSSGVDFITTGNHVFRRKEVYDLLDESEFIIRPANYAKTCPGKGYSIIDAGRYSIGVINLAGSMYLDKCNCPFEEADRLIEEIKKQTSIILVDFHAEATSEKKALGFYLDGRVSALFGTHTHVQTSDATILKNGTGYITDLGMCGVIDSVLGVDKDIVIEKFKSGMPCRFDGAKGECMLNGCIFTIDEKSGRCISVESVDLR